MNHCHVCSRLTTGAPASLQQFLLLQLLFETPTPSFQRGMNRRRRGGETPLQNRQGEPDRSLALFVETIRAVELFPDVAGDLLVEFPFRERKLIVDGIGAALREQRCVVKANKVFLRQPPHQIPVVRTRRIVTTATLEAIRIEKRQEELEIVLFPVVGRCGHQQQVSRQRRDRLGQANPVRLGGKLELIGVGVQLGQTGSIQMVNMGENSPIKRMRQRRQGISA